MTILNNRNFPDQYSNLYTSNTPKDVTIICKNGRLKAHRLILSNAIPLLRPILEEQVYFESVILVPDFNVTFLRAWLDFIYSGTWVIAESEKPELSSFLSTLRFDTPITYTTISAQDVVKIEHADKSSSVPAVSNVAHVIQNGSNPGLKSRRISDGNVKEKPKAKIRKTSLSDPSSSSKISSSVVSSSMSTNAARNSMASSDTSTSSASVPCTAIPALVISPLLRNESIPTLPKTTATTKVTYKCPVCFQLFLCSRDLKKHSDDDHKDVSEYTCEFCDKKFLMLKTLKQHIVHAHTRPRNVPGSSSSAGGENSIHVCHICKKIFKLAVSLGQHIKIHSKVQLGKPTTTNSSPKKIHVCNICKATFNTNATLLQHKKEHFIFSCKLCNLCFKSQVEYQDHVETNSTTHAPVVTNSGNFACPICSKEFLRQDLCSRHIQVHAEKKSVQSKPKRKRTGSKQFMCHFCNKTFHIKVMQQKHINECNQKTLVCRMCKEVFQTAKQTHRHLSEGKCKKAGAPKRKNTTLKYSAVREQRTCFVFGCNNEFPNYKTMMDHSRTHEKNARFHCTICGQFFKNRTTVLKHRMSDHFNLRFECDICGKIFVYKSSLSAHKVKYHDANASNNNMTMENDISKESKESIVVLD